MNFRTTTTAMNEQIEAPTAEAEGIPLKTGKRALFKTNAQVFWTENGKQWHYADVCKTQRPTSKQVKIVDLGLVNIINGKLYRTILSPDVANVPLFVRASELYTPDEFKEATGVETIPSNFAKVPSKKKAAPEVEATAVEAPAPIVEATAVEASAPIVEATAVEAPAPIVEATAVEAPAPIVEATAVEETEAYPDGVSKSSTVGRVRAEEALQALKIPAMLKGGQQVFWLSGSDEYRKAEIHRDQRSRSSKRIQIVDWQQGASYGSDPHWVDISSIYTPEQIKQKAASQRNTGPATNPAQIADGQWLYWTAKPGDVRVVQCVVTPISPEHLVWVREYKEGRLCVDKFTARPEALDTIDSQEVIEEAKRIASACEARIEQDRLKDNEIYKAELEAAYLSQFSPEEVAEQNLSFTSPEDFANKMEKLDTPDKIKALCDRLMALPMYSNPNLSAKTKMQRLGEYNKAINAMCNEMGGLLYEGNRTFCYQNRDGSTRLRHLYFKFVGIADYDWDADKKKAATKLVNKLDNQAVEIDSTRYLKTVRECINSQNPYVVLTALIAACGRRPIEVLEVGTFSAVEDEPKMLLFGGQAKKRDEPLDPYNIILLELSSETFIYRLQWVKSQIYQKATEGLDREASDFLKRLSDRVRVEVNRNGVGKFFDWLPPRAGESNPTCKTLRSVWAAIVADHHCPPTTSKLLYMSRLLGHFEGDPAALQTTLGYSDVIVSQGNKDALKAIPAPAKATSAPTEVAVESEQIAPESPEVKPATVKIKVLTLHQPWAELMVEGLKLIETRDWHTKHRGPIAIHAADRKVNPDGPVDLLDIPESEYIRGAIVAIAYLSDCVLMDEEFIAKQSETEIRCGLWEVGRYAFIFSKFETISPIKAKGNRKLWTWEMPAALNVNLYPAEIIKADEDAANKKTDSLVNNGVPSVVNSPIDCDVPNNVIAQPQSIGASSLELTSAIDSADHNSSVSGDADLNVLANVPADSTKQETVSEQAPTTYNSYLETVESNSGRRHDLDFYETQDWLPLLMLEQLPISGTVGEPAAGYGAIADVFRMAGLNVWTSDLDTAKSADYHGDATTESHWENLPEADWIVTNPPFSASSAILELAYKYAKRGVVLVLPIGWFEVCKDRVEFLKQYPPTTLLNVPRYCYKKGTKSDKWATDKGPAIVYVWDKQSPHQGLTKLLSFAVNDIALYYRTPDQRFTVARVKAEVERVMATRKIATVETTPQKPLPKLKNARKKTVEVVSKSQDKTIKILDKAIERINEAMNPFLEYNNKLPIPERWYVSQTIVATVAACNNNTANLWINLYREFLEKHNKGLNRSSQNRGREFSW